MAQFSAFAPFGLFDFSSDTSPAESAYNAIVGNVGKAFAPTVGSYAEAKIFAIAIMLGCAKATIRRAANQRVPTKSVDKLPTLERNYGIVPGPTDTVIQRQDRVAARKMLMRGSREEAVTTELIALLGADLIKYRVAKAADRVVYPTDPRTVGTFPRVDAELLFGVLDEPIGFPSSAVAVHVTLRTASTRPLAGMKITIEPEVDGIAEAADIVSWTPDTVGGQPSLTSGTLVVSCANPHSEGAQITNASPLWRSTQREVCVIVSIAAAKDAETRRKIHEIMARHCRTATRWEIMAASSSTTVGPFLVGAGNNTIGATAIGDTAFVF